MAKEIKFKLSQKYEDAEEPKIVLKKMILNAHRIRNKLKNLTSN